MRIGLFTRLFHYHAPCDKRSATRVHSVKIRNYKILHDADYSARINTRECFLFFPAEVSKPVKAQQGEKDGGGGGRKSEDDTPSRFRGRN